MSLNSDLMIHYIYVHIVAIAGNINRKIPSKMSHESSLEFHLSEVKRDHANKISPMMNYYRRKWCFYRKI